mgnify:CR=1 FL=1
MDRYYVEVNGMVRKTDTFPYIESMTLADALILAQGFKMEAASSFFNCNGKRCSFVLCIWMPKVFVIYVLKI